MNALVAALGKRAASAARTLAGELQNAAAPRTDFERYVAQKKAPTPAPAVVKRPASGPIVTPPPRTRVEVEEEEEALEEKSRARARQRR